MIMQELKNEFRKSMKIGKDAGHNLMIREAIVAGYLDVCRRPLCGLNQSVYDECGKTSKEVRDEFIDSCFIPAIKKLETFNDFDKWHRELCKCVFEYYDRCGYSKFYLGKAQKWINMSLKYIWLYCDEISLQKWISVLHVPIDRFIANDIAKEIGFLPGYGERFFTDLDSSFDSNKRNYCWSNITDYEEYIKCQRAIRKKIQDTTPIEWEFEHWLCERKKRY